MLRSSEETSQLNTATTNQSAGGLKRQIGVKTAAALLVGEVIAVGDSPYDAEAAAKAGIRTVGVLCGGFPERTLRLAGCAAIYRDPADLLASKTIRIARAD